MLSIPETPKKEVYKMEFVLKFNMDNAAFDYKPEAEIYFILTKIAHDVMNGKVMDPIMDHNGNTIGEWEIETD
jgi:hypothetical protein